MKKLLWNVLATLALPLFFLAALIPSRKRRYLVWGSRCLISNKYWSNAMKRRGHDSLTIMEGWFAINKQADFDRYFQDFAPEWLPRRVRIGLGACLALIFLLRRGRVLHTSFEGFALRATIYWKLESVLLRIAGVKTIVMSYGFDSYIYADVRDPSIRHGLLASYPGQALVEKRIRAQVDHWNAAADAVLVGPMVDGLGRWDVTTPCIFTINADEWEPKDSYSSADGVNGTVRILHTPNHRGFKGTEFLIKAVERLKDEGLLVELVLLEGVPNDKIRDVMRTVDVLADQFISYGYAMSAIEGMALGLPILCNLDDIYYTRVFRRYAFLDECPAVSTTPELLADDLRALIRNPALREQLGRAGRAYVEKYHSDRMAWHLFESIYDKVLHGKAVDLIHLFHPLKSDYNRDLPAIEHPLINSRLPSGAVIAAGDTNARAP